MKNIIGVLSVLGLSFIAITTLTFGLFFTAAFFVLPANAYLLLYGMLFVIVGLVILKIAATVNKAF